MNSTAIQPGPALSAQRVQYRVGHGGFHATIVEDASTKQHLVYVYDVGACPDVALLEDAIDRFVKRLVARGIKRLQYVILSHIDEDHVSRLDHLLGKLGDKKIAVETLALPWLRDTSRLLALNRSPRRGPSTVVYQLLQDDDSVVQFATNLGVENVLFVEGESSDDGGGTDGSDAAPSTPRSHASNATYIPSGTPLKVPTGIPWRMLISHLEPPTQTLMAFDKRVIQVTGLDPADQKNHAKLIKDHRSEIRAAMRFAARKTKLDLRASTVSNWSSQSLYSASLSPFARHVVPHAPDDFEMECEHGWLHTGDLPLDVPDVWDAFETAWNRHLPGVEVCVALAPHHGSVHGHNDGLYVRFNPSVVIFPLGLWRGSRRGKPMFAKWIKPMNALIDVRKHRTIKVRILNNRV
ncbi:hypothetical protein GCM10010458_06900 [Microbacterium luteolum]|uniref:MBL fold metallo-hydrolase n=1 Tax=Microbacterium luteolum TaxID=69367 RepID=A0ABY7XNJ2_MICLT|nr:MBL fold metallo-hydrolase [Microbacterium luteolum]WDM43476.1 MBL fold metallo-hydrolase [Microbacterium luteolum]